MAIVRRREAVDRVRAPPRVQRVEQLRSKAVAVAPHRRHVRKVVSPLIQLSRHPLGRAQGSAVDLGIEEGHHQGLQRGVR